MKKYTPELGQATFGQKYKQYHVEEILEAALLMISREWDKIMWNINQKETPSPFENTATTWKCDIFEVEAYSWDEDYNQPYNFKYKDIEISWYKYFGRGMSVNRQVKYSEIQEMLIDCLKTLQQYEIQNNKNLE